MIPRAGQVVPFSTIVRLEGPLREQLLESRFPNYSGIGENLAWRNGLSSAINQPPSSKVGKANGVTIEHSKFDAGLKILGTKLVAHQELRSGKIVPALHVCGTKVLERGLNYRLDREFPAKWSPPTSKNLGPLLRGFFRQGSHGT